MSIKDRMQVKQVDGVTVIRFGDSQMINVDAIEDLGEELMALHEQHGRTQLLLNLAGVEYFSSAVLGKFVALNNRVRPAGGAVRVCCLHPQIREIFHICKLDRVFDIAETEAEALPMFTT